MFRLAYHNPALVWSRQLDFDALKRMGEAIIAGIELAGRRVDKAAQDAVEGRSAAGEAV